MKNGGGFGSERKVISLCSITNQLLTRPGSKLCRSYGYKNKSPKGFLFIWRKREDSNLRYGCPHTRFPSVLLKPLGHTSVCWSARGAGCGVASLGRDPYGVIITQVVTVRERKLGIAADRGIGNVAYKLRGGKIGETIGETRLDWG